MEKSSVSVEGSRGKFQASVVNSWMRNRAALNRQSIGLIGFSRFTSPSTMTRSCCVEQLHSRWAVLHKGRVGLSELTCSKSESPSDASVIFIPHTTSYGHLFANHLSPNMGRKSWATPPQLEFLRSEALDLARAKQDGGLIGFYASTTQKFFEKWGAEPIVPADPALSPEEQLEEARKRLATVCIFFRYPMASHSRSLPAYQQLVQRTPKGSQETSKGGPPFRHQVKVWPTRLDRKVQAQDASLHWGRIPIY